MHTAHSATARYARSGLTALGVGAVLLAFTGCGYFTAEDPERFPSDPDTYRFSAGDGVNIEGVGPLAVRNVLVVANESGTEGNLIAAIINNTDDDHVLHIAVGEASGTELEIPVPAETTVSFGNSAGLENPPLIEDLDAMPGSTVTMHFRAGQSEESSAEIPVLGPCLDYLDGLAPKDPGSSDECPEYLDEDS